MERQQIAKGLNSNGYIVPVRCNFILENRNSRTYVLGEIITPEESKYLAKVMLYEMTPNNRENMLRLENFLIDNKVPFQHQKKN